MNLELMAMRWLWLEKNCHYVLEQRSPRYHLGSPDVLGVTAARFLVEIEIKRSASDFYADKNKSCRRNRDLFPHLMAKNFYYLMPRHLAEKMLDKIPEWSWLLCNSEHYLGLELLKNSPNNPSSEKLTIKECVKLARNMTNHTMSYALKNETPVSNFRGCDATSFIDWVSVKKGTYEI